MGGEVRGPTIRDASVHRRHRGRGRAHAGAEDAGAVRTRPPVPDETFAAPRVRSPAAPAPACRRAAHAVSLLEAVLASTSEGVLVVGTRGRVECFNPRLVDLWRVPPALAARPHAARWLAHAAAQLAAPEAFLSRVAWLRARPDEVGHDLLEFTDGRVFECYTRPQRLDGRVVGRVWAFTDASESRLAEIAIRSAEARCQSAERAVRDGHDGVFEWDPDTGAVVVSARWLEMLGLGPGDAPATAQAWLRRVHPDDAPGFTARLDAFRNGRTSALESEHRTLHGDGEWRWTLVRGWAAPGVAGRPARVAGTQADVHARRMAEERMRHGALHDAVTGLPNRTLFQDRLRLARRRLGTGGGANAVLLLDLDGFKTINESLGHPAGDRLLAAVARTLRAALAPEHTLARVGADEFAALLEGVDRPIEAGRTAAKLALALAARFPVAGHDVFVSACVGIAVGRGGPEGENLLRDAGTALYRARAAGRGRHQLFDPVMHVETAARLGLETDLRGALRRRELELYYQPIVHLPSGRADAFEALVRWNHPQRGLLLPNEFIPTAEDTGLIVPLGVWALHEACRLARAWRDDGEGPRVSVNVSARQLADPDVVGTIARALAQAGLAGSALQVEITESVLVANPAVAAEHLRRLRGMGVRVCMDDFGTGYSSLAYLHRFPVDVLKVDRSFVARLGMDRQSTEIVRTVLSLSRSLSLQAVAEGVETEEQRVLLEAMGCTHGQGYLFSPAVDASAATRLASRTFR